MSDLPELMAHYAWADARARESIVTLDAGGAEYMEAVRLYAHLAAAAHVWGSRIAGKTPLHPVWPALNLAEASELAAESIAGLAGAVAQGSEELARPVTYANSAGATFSNTVEEIVRQIVTHGAYHRGQIAFLVRRGGGQPLATDYIVFKRG